MRPIKPYPEEIEEKMIRYYNTLSEKERRRYAAIEAEKLGYGAISYIVRILGGRPDTIKRGFEELESTELINEARKARKRRRKKKMDRGH